MSLLAAARRASFGPPGMGVLVLRRSASVGLVCCELFVLVGGFRNRESGRDQFGLVLRWACI